MRVLSVFFFGCLCWSPCFASDHEQLIQALDQEYHALLENDPKRQLVEQAAQLLKQTNRSDHWPDYMQACRLLNNTRSKAAIPLLMKFMVVHASGESGGDAKAYAASIATLTGYKIEWTVSPPNHPPSLAVTASVRKALDEWWAPNRDQITLDFMQWPKEKLRSYVIELKPRIHELIEAFNYFESDDRYRLTQFLTSTMLQIRDSDRSPNIDGQIHPVMLPIILEEAGYRRDGSTDGNDWAKPKFPAEYIACLVSFRRNGVAPDLDKIARDSKQPASVRILCTLSLFIAGEALLSDVLLEIAEKETSVRYKTIAILALSHSSDTKAVGPSLIRYLDDPNFEVQLAAVNGLTGCKPTKAIPKLNELLMSDRIGRDRPVVLRLLGEIKTRESEKALFDFLERSLNDPRYKESTYAALSAFSTVCDVSWTEAGAHDNAYYERSARKAISWWRGNERARIAIQRLDDLDFRTGDDSPSTQGELHNFYQTVVEAIFANSTTGWERFLMPSGAIDSTRFFKSREDWRTNFEITPTEVRKLSADVYLIGTSSHAITIVRTATTGLRLLDITVRNQVPSRQ